jgi:UDP-glucose 4-epimerase
MESILITGSAGFIGSNICKIALEKGYKVYGLDKNETNIDGVKNVVGSVTDKELVKRITKGVDYIIHTAAITSVVEFEKYMYGSYTTNISGFNSLIDSAYQNKIKKFLYASSSAVYLDSFSEDDLIDIRRLKNHYSKSKLMNEMVAESYFTSYNMNTIGMRFFNVYGDGENNKGDYASIISRFLKANLRGKPLLVYGDGKQARDFINVKDVAIIVLKLLENVDNGIYNVGTGKAVEYNYIADLINKEKKEYIKNPLSTYQHLTKADTTKLIKAIGKYDFKTVNEFITEKSILRR